MYNINALGLPFTPRRISMEQQLLTCEQDYQAWKMMYHPYKVEPPKSYPCVAVFYQHSGEYDYTSYTYVYRFSSIDQDPDFHY